MEIIEITDVMDTGTIEITDEQLEVSASITVDTTLITVDTTIITADKI